MPARAKTRSEILQQVYLTKADIQRLMKVSYPVAVKIFDKALAIDQSELQFRPWETRVRLQTVLNINGVTYTQLEKQIKSATT